MKEDHHQDKFRVNSTSNEYWMIENGYLRLVPDLTTLEALHHFRMSDDKGHDVHTDLLTPMDLFDGLSYWNGTTFTKRFATN